jgi:hypothetical protein
MGAIARRPQWERHSRRRAEGDRRRARARSELLDLHTRSVTSGKDSLAEVTVRVRHADQETSTRPPPAVQSGDAQGILRGRRGPPTRPAADQPRTCSRKLWDGHGACRHRNLRHLHRSAPDPRSHHRRRSSAARARPEVRRPIAFATTDHATPTEFERVGEDRDPRRAGLPRSRHSRRTAPTSASRSARPGNERQGIVHVTAELGLTQPGRRSSAATTTPALPALALAFGIGSEIHCAASRTCAGNRSSMSINVEGASARASPPGPDPRRAAKIGVAAPAVRDRVLAAAASGAHPGRAMTLALYIDRGRRPPA